MIAVDSSVVIRLLNGVEHPACERLAAELAKGRVRLPPVTLTEVLSASTLTPDAAEFLATIPVIEPIDGYWARTGALRAKLRRQGRKAALGDALIAQSCIDAGIPLLALDVDFRAFAEVAGLELVEV